MVSEKRFVQADDVETIQLDWGTLKWMNTPEVTASEGLSAGVVLLEPGKGHERHTHPDSEEILYFLGGEGEQTIEDETRTVGAGDMVHIPSGVEHSTINTSWEPLRFLAVYCPPGPEAVIREDDDATVFPPGEFPDN
ncbi:cupin [Haloferax sp. Atlit-12N]|uniref:cupin domain-containing protein n=1 Tax=Haloferax sp. Atlit-12N TaxID=2077203 RepID=UPI000E269C69|nr:cupin domain-containing protein [Haloferax sp. Atlit-12N]RDZ62387.1 cupin [Haloferax sp. Atlit-12N]